MKEPTPPRRSLEEVHRSVEVPRRGNLFRRIFAIAGPAYLVSVGYMDPGNWATDLAAGSRYGYALLWVLLVSNGMAVLLQSLAARLGIATGLDLAQACRAEYPRPVRLVLYALCEVAIAACDLAEVLGSAIALKLLLGLPLLYGVLVTAADTLALLFLSHLGIRKLEALILGMVTLIGAGFLLEVFLARPEWGGLLRGFVPSLPDASALFIAIGMLGATVMPHNLYLHSALVQTRRIGASRQEKRQAIRLNTLDSVVALNVAFFVNAAILVMAAAVFHRSGHTGVADILEAHRLLEPIVGASVAPLVFALALLAAGQSSTITGTLAGQIVMEGFLEFRIPPWLRRLLTRLAAIAPAAATLLLFGESKTGTLLILSQVVLSLQLPFAVVPLVRFVSDRKTMGPFAAGPVVKTLGWLSALTVAGLNGALVFIESRALYAGAGPWALPVFLVLGAFHAGLAALFLYVALKPVTGTGGVSPPAGVHAPPRPLVLEEEAVPYRKVAIALDFSGREEEILREALRLFGAQRPELFLLHVVESAGARFLGKEAADQESARDAERLEAYAEALRQKGFQATAHLGVGRPVAELYRMIQALEPDLVVLGAHGHRFLGDLLRGSTADALRHRVKASVLVVGPPSG
ncbi:MAG: Nramp family divalent metal transporter [Acidobacteriota bacterium]